MIFGELAETSEGSVQLKFGNHWTNAMGVTWKTKFASSGAGTFARVGGRVKRTDNIFHQNTCPLSFPRECFYFLWHIKWSLSYETELIRLSILRVALFQIVFFFCMLLRHATRKVNNRVSSFSQETYILICERKKKHSGWKQRPKVYPKKILFAL